MMNKKIRLLILLKSIDGGTGTYLEGLLELKKIYKPGEIEIRVLVLEKPKFRKKKTDGYTYFPRKKPIDGKYHFNFGVLKSLANETLWFKNNVNEFNPNIVLSSDSHSILITESSRWMFGLNYKSVSIIQNNLEKVFEYRLAKKIRWLIKLTLGYFLNKSDRVVTVSKVLSRDIYRSFNLRKVPDTISVIIPNQVPNKKSNKLLCNNIVISVARLDTQKDHSTLLRAFRLVCNRIKNSQLWIIGDGPLRKRLEKLSVVLGINQHVKFVGWVQNPETYLDRSDLFVLSSKWEGFPLSLLEAMGRNLPVVASDCKYGSGEIIGKNKYGILFPVGDYNELAKEIIFLLENHKMRSYYSNKSRERYLEYFSDKMILKYKKIINCLYEKQ